MNSQIFKHLEWCMRKAEKEIEECKKQKKKVRHRGLIKIEPNQKLAAAHIEKAIHNLKLLNFLRENGFSDWSVTAGFYSMYHCFLAIAIKFGYESKNQICTIALIESLQNEGKIKINKEIIELMKYEEEQNIHEESIIEAREEYSYGIDLEIKDNKYLDKVEKLCQEMIDATKDIAYESRQ